MTLKTRTTTVPLFQGDDLDPIEDLRQDVLAATRWRDMVLEEDGEDDPEPPSAPARKGETSAAAPSRLQQANDALRDAAQKYDEFKTEAAERAERVTIQAVGRRVWRDLLKAHPKRLISIDPPADGDATSDDDAPGDTATPTSAGAGQMVDPEDARWGFNFETLGDDLLPQSMVDKTAHDEAFLDGLSDGEWSKLYVAAVILNQAGGPDPKARLSSLVAQTSGASSASPSRST